jgi:2-iminobutanoate/2-iminopropanoate deaminase
MSRHFSRLVASASAAIGLAIAFPQDSLAQGMKREILQPTWEAKYSFSPAVVTQGGKVVWLAGQVGFVDDNRKPLNGDFDAQVRQTFKNIQRVMEKTGGSLRDIVSMTVFVGDGRHALRFTELRKEFWPKADYPASTLIVAAGFALPEIMVEITGYAVVEK